VWGNHFVTDNRAIGPEDFYGDTTTYWHGVDFTVNARMTNGLTIQGGGSGGRGVRDHCEITAALPEPFVTAGAVLLNAQRDACAVTEPWLTTYRLSATYTIPRIDVLVSGAYRSTPNTQPSTINTFVATNGASVAANYNVTSAILQQSTLGRLRLLQRPQRQYRHGVQSGVRRGLERRQLAAADERPQSAVCALQRDGEFLEEIPNPKSQIPNPNAEARALGLGPGISGFGWNFFGISVWDFRLGFGIWDLGFGI
jgi:hypothetical protein